jgi:septal ring-binding cell division protein DamX
VPLALYVLDIDGSHLLRVAGPERLPGRIQAPLAVGPELDADGLTSLREQLKGQPGAQVVPLWLRGRATGVMITLGEPQGSLTELARQASAAMALADRYTDSFARAQRRKQPKAAAEMQQSMLPPRIARVTGGEVAGNVVSSYEVEATGSTSSRTSTGSGSHSLTDSVARRGRPPRLRSPSARFAPPEEVAHQSLKR